MVSGAIWLKWKSMVFMIFDTYKFYFVIVFNLVQHKFVDDVSFSATIL